MNGFIDLLLQNMSGGQKPKATADVGAGREGFGIRKPGLIDLRKIKEPQRQPMMDVAQTDIETPTEDVDVTATYQQPQTSQSENILRQTMQSIADLQNKEYTQGKGGFKDILKGLGLGALESLGKSDPRQGLAGMLGAATGGAAGLGIRSAIDSSADDRFIDERKMNKLYQDAAAQGQIVDSEVRRQDVLNRGKDRETDNARLQADLERQAKRDAVKAQLDQDKLDFNIDVAQKMAVWRNRKLEADMAGNAVKAKQAQQRIDELIRNNQVKADQTERKGMPKNNVPLPPSTMKTPTTVPAKTALEGGLTSRGIKPGSPEWNKVMQAAGY